MERLDEADDENFYDEPKLVEHIDEAAVSALTSFHEKELKNVAARMRKSSKELRVLDLCSSWVSHLGDWAKKGSPYVFGVGMNEEELKANMALADHTVQNLNTQTALGFEEGAFDCVLCQLSIDYLVNPTAVIKEALRTLSPGGELIITFSNRVFFTKAVALWTGKSDLEHLETVGNYIHFSGAPAVKKIEAFDILPSASRSGGDPLYAVIAEKS
mmetsp:Transcript_38414/g.61656  ORF Transcript_38414/g.61656 Transcript_38414/m.61656 type:complete len:215 (-) Transcript_38414:177-821(-)